MNWILIALCAIAGIYIVGFVVALFLFKGSDSTLKYAALWPAMLLWMLFGNIQ